MSTHRSVNGAVFESVMVTGHRLMPLEQELFARAELDRLAVKLAAAGTREAVSGMALGADTWWAEAALNAGLELAAYIPTLKQPDKWSQADRRMWEWLRGQAAREVVVGDGVSARVFHARNDAMLADADALICAGSRTRRWRNGCDVPESDRCGVADDPG